MKIGKAVSRRIVATVLFLIGIAWLPYAWNSRWADRWFARNVELQTQLANGMAEGLDRENFTTDQSCLAANGCMGRM